MNIKYLGSGLLGLEVEARLAVLGLKGSGSGVSGFLWPLVCMV